MDAAKQSEPVIRFRNYTPQSQSAPRKARETLPQPATQTEVPAAAAEVVTADAADAAGGGESRRALPIDPVKKELMEYAGHEINIIPMKPNSDLKNMVAKRLDKLQRRTQIAIVEMLREKMNEEDDDEGA